MSLVRLKHDFGRLKNIKKAVVVAGFFIFIFTLLPWLEFTNTGIQYTNNGAVNISDSRGNEVIHISGLGASIKDEEGNKTLLRSLESMPKVFGILSILFAITYMAIFIREALTRNKQIFSVAHYQILLIAGVEAVFAFFIAYFVFSSFDKAYTVAEFKYGFYLSVIGHIFVLISSYLIYLEERASIKKVTKPINHLSDEEIAKLNLQPEISEDQMTIDDKTMN